MKKSLAHAVVVLCLATASPTQAFGVCVEDKMAAAYDHALITREFERGHEVMFLEILGAAPADHIQWRFLIGAVEGVAGVQRGSVRTFASPPAISFAFDASRISSAAALARINDRLRKHQVKVELIRVIAQSEIATRQRGATR